MSKPCAVARGMIFSLKGTSAPSVNPPITTFFPAAFAGVAEPRPARSAAPAPPLSKLRRLTPPRPVSVELIALPPVIDPVNDGHALRIEKECVVRVEFRSDLRAHASCKAPWRAHGKMFVAHAHVDQRLIAHGFNDIDLA